METKNPNSRQSSVHGYEECWKRRLPRGFRRASHHRRHLNSGRGLVWRGQSLWQAKGPKYLHTSRQIYEVAQGRFTHITLETKISMFRFRKQPTPDESTLLQYSFCNPYFVRSGTIGNTHVLCDVTRPFALPYTSLTVIPTLCCAVSRNTFLLISFPLES